MATISVTYVNGPNVEIVQETIAGMLTKFDRIRSLELTLRSAIETANGPTRTVLQDLYRWLVISNFATLNKQKGKTARSELEELYPDGGSLPNFIVVSKHFNTAGAIFHNIKSHPNGEDGYGLLPSILLGLLQAGLPKAVCESQLEARNSAIGLSATSN
jgi:hypothetical protein